MAVDIFVPIGAFVMIAVVVGMLTQLIATGMLNRTIREALRSDPGSVPLLANKLAARQPWADALLGWILLALAVALVVLGLFEESDDRRELFQAAVVPVVVGIAVLVYVRLVRPRAP